MDISERSSKETDYLSIFLEEIVQHPYDERVHYIRLLDYAGISMDADNSVTILFDLGYWPETWRLETEIQRFRQLLGSFIDIVQSCFFGPLRTDIIFSAGLLYLHAFNPRSDDDLKFPNSNVPKYSDLIEFSYRAVQRARDELGLETRAVVGRYAPRSIPETFYALSEALKFRAFIGDASPVYVEKDNEQLLSEFFHTPDKEIFSFIRQMFNAVSKGDPVMMEKSVNSFFEYIQSFGINNRNELNFVSCALFPSLLQMIKEKHPPTEWFSSFPIYANLYSTSSLAEMCADITKSLEGLSLEMKERRSDNINEKISEIKNYVNMNYAQMDMSVSSLADKFSLSQSYLSVQFKNRMGIGLLEYIHKCRIDHAKILIDTTDHNLSAISDMVGFGNVSTMFRAFKKYEGTTPGAERK